ATPGCGGSSRTGGRSSGRSPTRCSRTVRTRPAAMAYRAGCARRSGTVHASCHGPSASRCTGTRPDAREAALFLCSRPVVGFDHLRVPYRVADATPGPDGCVTALAPGGRALRWPAFDRAGPGPARFFGLGKLRLYGRLLPDADLRDLLGRTGGGWRPVEELAGGDGADCWEGRAGLGARAQSRRGSGGRGAAGTAAARRRARGRVPVGLEPRARPVRGTRASPGRATRGRLRDRAARPVPRRPGRRRRRVRAAAARDGALGAAVGRRRVPLAAR